MKKIIPFFSLVLAFMNVSCSRTPELTLAEIEELTKDASSSLMAKSISKPWQGKGFKPGKTGGVWNDTILSDP